MLCTSHILTCCAFPQAVSLGSAHDAVDRKTTSLGATSSPAAEDHHVSDARREIEKRSHLEDPIGMPQWASHVRGQIFGSSEEVVLATEAGGPCTAALSKVQLLQEAERHCAARETAGSPHEENHGGLLEDSSLETGDKQQRVRSVLEQWARERKSEAVALKKEVLDLKKKKHLMLALMRRAEESGSQERSPLEGREDLMLGVVEEEEFSPHRRL